jgi:FkbM family methyltransferase
LVKDHDANRYLSLYDGPLDVVVDVGAHVGMLSLYAAERGARRVLAYEAHPGLARTLAENAKRMNGTIEVYALAVAAETEAERSMVTDAMAAFDGLQPWTANLAVPTIAFRDVLAIGPIDYLKIDIEGGEHELFDSVTAEHLRHVRFLDLEVHHTSKHGEAEAYGLIDRVASFGFMADAFPSVIAKHGRYAVGRFNDGFSQ